MRVLALLLGLCLLAACSGEQRAAPEPTTAVPTTAGPTKAGPTSTGRHCNGIAYDDVLGPRPELGGATLRRTRVMSDVCAAYWAPHLDDYFTPQSLEIKGTTAYVGGYRWSPSVGNRPCQIAVLDTRTGEVQAFVKKFQAAVYGPEPTYCRHAGGMELTREGLWVAELQRLWLLDPAKLGTGDPVLRVWRLDRSVRGATVLVDGSTSPARIGFGSYHPSRPGVLVWFDLDEVLAPGRTLLRRRDAVAARAVPVRLQGITSTAAGVWFSSSDAHCGSLVAPGRKAVTFVHGAEDVEVVGPDLWTVSEAGVRAYLHGHDRIVPSLLRLDTKAVLAGPRPTCDW